MVRPNGILLVSNGFPPSAYGGVEVYVSILAQALHERGYKVTVLCAERQDAKADYTILKDTVLGIPVFRFVNNFKHIQHFSQTFSDDRVDRKFMDLISDLSPDLIHFNHLISLSANLPLLTSTAGIPSLITLHDFWFLCQRINLFDWRKSRCPGPRAGGDCFRCLATGTWSQQLRTFLIDTFRLVVPYPIRAWLRQALAQGGESLPGLAPTPEILAQRFALFRSAALVSSAVIAPSRFVRDMFIANDYPHNTIQVLPLGLDSPSLATSGHFSDSRSLTFAFLGSMVPLKGVDIVVKAFRQVKNPDVRLLLFGRDDIVPRYGKWLRRLARGDSRIYFMGPFSPEQKEAIYAAVDVVVVPSIVHETFSLVTHEALLRGKPVIASATGALSDVIVDGHNGFLVEPQSVEALRVTLERLASDRVLLGNLCQGVPPSVPSVSAHVDQIEALYRRAYNS